MPTSRRPHSTPSHPGPELSVVAPFRDESPSLPSFLNEIKAELDTLDLHYELIMVDDGSVDGGWKEVRSRQARWPNLTLVRLSRSFGKEAAIRAGIESGRSGAVIVLDADLQHPVNLIHEMVDIWRASDVWVVEAVKDGTVPRPPLKRLGASLFYPLMERITGLDMRNKSDFQLLDRRAVDLFLSLTERITTFRGIISWLGLPTERVFFTVGKRISGESRWSVRQLIGLALNMITGFSNTPLRLMTYASLVFGMLAFILAIQTLVVYFTGQALEGFTTVILVILVTGTALTIGLGIIGEYLARIYEEVKARPRFVVESVARGSEPEADPPV